MTTFAEAADALEAAWLFGGSLDAKHGFLFALRYGETDIARFEEVILLLKDLPGADDSISASEFAGFRRFVTTAWAIPMYLQDKRKSGVFLVDQMGPRYRTAYNQIIQEIIRILGHQRV